MWENEQGSDYIHTPQGIAKAQLIRQPAGVTYGEMRNVAPGADRSREASTVDFQGDT